MCETLVAMPAFSEEPHRITQLLELMFWHSVSMQNENDYQSTMDAREEACRILHLARTWTSGAKTGDTSKGDAASSGREVSQDTRPPPRAGPAGSTSMCDPLGAFEHEVKTERQAALDTQRKVHFRPYSRLSEGYSTLLQNIYKNEPYRTGDVIGNMIETGVDPNSPTSAPVAVEDESLPDQGVKQPGASSIALAPLSKLRRVRLKG